MRVLSLGYHDVVAPGAFASSGFSGADADVYKLERPEFERHLQAISRRGWPFRPTVASLEQSGIDRALLLTFDDGGVGALEQAAEALESHGWFGHFFVSTDYIGRPGFLSREQIRTLHGRGHVVGSHSCSHPARMSRCSWTQLLHEWGTSIAVLSDILGARVRSASVPGGYFSRRVAEAAGSCGVGFLFTSEPTTRVQVTAGCLVLGRYSVRRGTRAEVAAAIAAGDLAPRIRQAGYWCLKKLPKALFGGGWLRLRHAILARRGRRPRSAARPGNRPPG